VVFEVFVQLLELENKKKCNFKGYNL